MSADNGVYILKSGDEYRVAHCVCIEDCEPWDNEPEFHLWMQAIKFGGSPVYARDEAWEVARKIYDEIMNSDFPVCEYGVCELIGDEPFPQMTYAEAQQKLDEYWNLNARQR